MIKKFQFIIMGAILSLFVSCDSNSFDNEYVPGLTSHYLYLSNDSIAFDASGESTMYISVYTDGTPWHFYNIPSWISLEPVLGTDNQTIKIKAKENTNENSMRSGSLAFASASDDFDYLREVYVFQDAKQPSIAVSQESVSFTYEASSQEISVQANFRWNVSVSDSWIKAVPSEDRQSLTIYVDENKQEFKRTATVTLTGSLTKTINVVQYPEIEIERAYTVTWNGKNVSFTMKYVEPGTFTMGSSLGGSLDKPEHTVTLTKGYFIGETEVTQALWYAVMGDSPKATTKDWKWNYVDGLGDDYPAYFINYNDCLQFISRLNAMTNEHFRLPTEAEWEFAARGGKKSNGYVFAGSSTIDNVGWYDGNSVRCHSVRAKYPNELGLYDMTGNLWEWCLDWYGAYTSKSQKDPTGPVSGTYRIIRGGSWYMYAPECRVFVRNGATPQSVSNDMGLRLVLQ